MRRKQKDQPAAGKDLNSLPTTELNRTDIKDTAAPFVIRPGVLFNLKDILHYRELLYFLVWRDVLIRYKQTILGGLWEIFKPLSTMIIFTIFMGYIIRVPSDGVPYPIFYYSALLLWTFFAQSMNMGSLSIIGASSLVNKIYFPRIIIPITAVSSSFFDLLMAFPVLIVFMIYYGIYPSWKIIFLPIILLHVAISSLGIALIFSASIVRYRDLQNVLPAFTQSLMFASPIMYPVSMIPQKWLPLYGLNPMAFAVEAFRHMLFGGVAKNLLYLTPGLLVGLVTLFIGFKYFQKASCSFADWI